jgi:hypothetical protein
MASAAASGSTTQIGQKYPREVTAQITIVRAASAELATACALSARRDGGVRVVAASVDVCRFGSA